MINRFILLITLFFICCIYSNAQDWNPVSKIIANDRAAEDWFGHDVDIHGDYAVVGTPQKDHNGFANAGAAYIYKKEGTNWILNQKLTASDGAEGDGFGHSVSIENEYVVVTAFKNNNIGAAYIFKLNNGIWTEQQKIFGSDLTAGAQFGVSVDLDGNFLAVGANFQNNEGAVYHFMRDGDIWIQTQKIQANDLHFSQFGFSLVLKGNNLLVGAPLNSFDENQNSVFSMGAAYIFNKENNLWTQSQKIFSSDGASNDWFGRSVDLEDDYFIVGADSESHDANGGSNVSGAGSAYIFKLEGNNWTQKQKIVASDRTSYAGFGFDVKLKDEIAIVGASAARGKDNVLYAGAAYVFKKTEETWSQTQKIVSIDNNAMLDNFGNAVAIYNKTLFIGTYRQDNDENGENAVEDAGAAYFYELCDLDISISSTSTTLTADFTETGATYQWLDCDNDNIPIDGATSQTFTPTQSGNYAVQITTATGCVGVSECTSFCNAGEITITQNETVLTAVYEGNAVSYQWYNCTTNTAISGATSSTFTAIETGEYSVIITDELGCETVSECVQVCLGVNTNVQVQGNTLTALYAEGISYQWLDCDNGNTPISGAVNQSFIASQSGSFAVQITDEFGCVSTSACITVCIPIDLNITVTAEAMIADYNGSGATYQWIDCNNNNEPIAGATGQSFTPETEGYYAVIITDAYGCVSISECTSSEFLGSDQLNISELSIYPNPVKDYLSINTANSSKQLSAYYIFNGLGQLIETKTIKSESDLKINVTNYPSGAYILNVQIGKENKSFKFLVK